MDKYQKIFDSLKNRFPVAKCELNFKNNYELIVAVILSAQCTDKRVNLTTPALFEKYPTVFDLAKANKDELISLIRSCGFYNNKSTNLIKMANDVVEKFNGVVPSEFEDLVSLAGVGRKTANVVMSVAFGKNAIAVDTHVFRVANRLGITSKTPLECELKLQKLFKEDKWSELHYFLVLFGRYVCKAKKPSCETCEFQEICQFFKKNWEKRRFLLFFWKIFDIILIEIEHSISRVLRNYFLGLQ